MTPRARQAIRRAAQALLARRRALAWGLYLLGLAGFLALPLASNEVSVDEKAVLFAFGPAARWAAALLAAQRPCAPAPALSPRPGPAPPGPRRHNRAALTPAAGPPSGW